MKSGLGKNLKDAIALSLLGILLLSSKSAFA